MVKKARYIRGKEREVYQGKGNGGISGERGGVSRKRKRTYIRGKEREVISGETKGRCIREREGDECQE